MKRRTQKFRSLTPALGLALICTAPGARAEDPPDLSGTWELNEELSDNPRERIREAMSSRRGGSRSGGGGGRPGFGGGGGRPPGFGGGTGGAGGQRGGGDPETRRQRMAAMWESAAHIEITHDDPSLTIRRGTESEEETLYTDGRDFFLHGPGGELLDATARWKGDTRLVVESSRDANSQRAESYELSADGQQLYITVKTPARGRMPSIELRRIYDRVEVTADS